jgi:hypothetical protein
MKKGKTSKMDGFKNSKVLYGTVDSKNLKSLYLNLQTWAEPKDESDNWPRVIMNMNRSVKHSIYNNLDTSLFNKNYIVDLDLRSSGIHPNKKSFMNLEINLYLTENMDFKSSEIKKSLKNLVKRIYSEVLNNNSHFDFYLTKNGNYREVKVKTDKV